MSHLKVKPKLTDVMEKIEKSLKLSKKSILIRCCSYNNRHRRCKYHESRGEPGNSQKNKRIEVKK